MTKRKYDVHGTVPVTVHITIEAEDGEQAIEFATQKFKGIHIYMGNGGGDKLIGVEGSDESITVDGDVEFDEWTEH